jgi:hypothetical protein
MANNLVNIVVVFQRGAIKRQRGAATTGNRVFTESWKLRREPNLQLSVKPLFAESTRSGSRRRTGPR